MKTKLLLGGLIASFSLGASAFAADVSVKLTDVHLCCDSCVRGVEKAIAPIEGAKATVDKDAQTVVISAPNKATEQKAVDALVAAGYYGVSDDAAVKVTAPNNAQDATVKSLHVEGVHMCCKKCVSSVNKALAKVPGVTGTTAQKGEDAFDINGEFNAKAAIQALRDEGLSGKAKS